jgi:hypothetical protein
VKIAAENWNCECSYSNLWCFENGGKFKNILADKCEEFWLKENKEWLDLFKVHEIRGKLMIFPKSVRSSP